MKQYLLLALLFTITTVKGQIQCSIKPRLAYTTPLIIWYDKDARAYHKSIGFYPINNKGSFRPALSLQLAHELGKNWSIFYGLDYKGYHYRYEDTTYTLVQLANGTILKGNRNKDTRSFHYIGGHLGINYSIWNKFGVQLDFFVNRLLGVKEHYKTYRDDALIWEGVKTWRWNWPQLDYIRTWDVGFRWSLEHRLNPWLQIGWSYQVSLNPIYISTGGPHDYDIYHQSTSLYLSFDFLFKKKKARPLPKPNY
ncbi:MAG: hypothetical protein ACRBFS_25770 [Aureispira sp.]